MSLRDAINPFFTDARDIAQLIAPVCAVLGMIGLGITYMGSSWPLIGDWRRDNPRVADQIIHTASCHFQHRLTQSAFSR
ncbi:MAG: hypothetical protein IT323_03735, partial [Anaerolineae bacterium]|nr:hypothetical protein [Anaerolineae bacterium]